MKKIAQGAEAVLYLDKDKVIKSRIPKSYRLREIDEELRKSRTKREAKVIESIPVSAPKMLSVDTKKMKLEIEHIKGDKLSDVLEKKDYKKLCLEIGRMTRKMHDKDIIHSDLTTSNMILNPKGKIYFIDFGLSFFSIKAEDKAVDLHLLRQALESRHHTIYEACFKQVLKGYADKTVINRLEIVEKRGRNKGKF